MKALESNIRENGKEAIFRDILAVDIQEIMKANNPHI